MAKRKADAALAEAKETPAASATTITEQLSAPGDFDWFSPFRTEPPSLAIAMLAPSLRPTQFPSIPPPR